MGKFFKVIQTVLLMAAVGLANLAYAGNNVHTRNFVINYGTGIHNVEIIFSSGYSNRGHTSGLTVTSSSSFTRTTVSVNSGLDNSSFMADSFNNTYPYKWQKLEMDSSKSAPEKLDFWVEGLLIIDGLPVDSTNKELGFSWAHDGKSGNWWIANNVFVNRNVDNDGLTIGANDGNQIISYCMKANKNSNYSVTISKGACSPVKLNFVFNYDGTTVKSVNFKNYYNPALSAGLLSYESIVSQSTTYKTTLTFTSQRNNNNLLADQFNAAYDADHSLNLNGKTTDKASPLDFWAEGDLFINDSMIVKTEAVPHAGFSFAHEYNTTNWWIADNSGMAYISPGHFYLLDLITEDGNLYCLSGDKGLNYSVTVTAGKCKVPGMSNYEFYIRQAGYYTSLSYKVSPNNPDPNGLPNFKSVVVTQLDKNKVRVDVTSVKNNSSSLANDFAALYSPEANMLVAHGSQERPSFLNFWLSGQVTLTIGKLSSGKNESFDLDLALDGNEDNGWWVASPYGHRNWAFERTIWELIVLGTRAKIVPEQTLIGYKPDTIIIVGGSNH